MIKAAYIHIPFCKNICSYCDFCKNYYNEKIVDKYLESLDKEIKGNYKEDVLSTIYIGGGTPSCLSLMQLEKLFIIIKKIKVNTNYEFTFECNYEDINEPLLIMLKKHGVNRISIGLQTFNKKFELLLERNINKSRMLESVVLVKKHFNNINVDLMYGFYHQNIKELEKDVDEFIKLGVTHISAYALTIGNNTKLNIYNTKELNDDDQSVMYNLINNKLKINKYNHYEISNYSKVGYESSHNMTYWNNEEYYGFGAGASGFIENIRYNNTKSINNYINGKTRINEEILNVDLLIKDEVMLNLRKTTGINKNQFKEKYNKDIKAIFNFDFLISNNLLKDTPQNIYIPEDKFFISNEIILKLFESSKLRVDNF
ncbi:MAG: radical SAM family heme chaperone HemW [Bacilli bacterium]